MNDLNWFAVFVVFDELAIDVEGGDIDEEDIEGGWLIVEKTFYNYTCVNTK